MNKANNVQPCKASPMLAGSELIGDKLPLKDLRFPKLISIKLNGIRGICRCGEWNSRTMKQLKMHPIVAKQFEVIANWSRDNQMVLDGEFHSPSLNTVGETLSVLAGTALMPQDFKFSCFYMLTRSEWNRPDKSLMQTVADRAAYTEIPSPRWDHIQHSPVQSAVQLECWLNKYKDRSIEGFVLIDPSGQYKHGRSTKLEQLCCKFKYYGDAEDGVIIGVTPRRQRKADVQGETRPDGYAQQVHTQDSFEYTSVGGCLLVKTERGEVINCPFPIGWDMQKRQEAYLHCNTGTMHDVIGQWISFRRLACENRGKPMCIKNVEIRDEK